MKKGAKNDAESGRVNSEAAGKKINANNSPKIVKQRGDGRNEKTALGLKNAGQKSRNGKENLGDRHNPNKIGHEIEFFGWIVGNDPGDGAGKDYQNRGKNKKYESDRGQGGVSQITCFGL